VLGVQLPLTIILFHLTFDLPVSFRTNSDEPLLPFSPGGRIAPAGEGGVAMTVTCIECGRIVSKLNAEKKCEECARKEESMKSYFAKLFFINEGCARLVPAT
jgi:hypothetical protein